MTDTPSWWPARRVKIPAWFNGRATDSNICNGRSVVDNHRAPMLLLKFKFWFRRKFHTTNTFRNWITCKRTSYYCHTPMIYNAGCYVYAEAKAVLEENLVYSTICYAPFAIYANFALPIQNAWMENRDEESSSFLLIDSEEAEKYLRHRDLVRSRSQDTLLYAKGNYSPPQSKFISLYMPRGEMVNNWLTLRKRTAPWMNAMPSPPKIRNAHNQNMTKSGIQFVKNVFWMRIRATPYPCNEFWRKQPARITTVPKKRRKYQMH